MWRFPWGRPKSSRELAFEGPALRVFVSHSSSQLKQALALSKRLIGSKRFTVWIDRTELNRGDSLTGKISEGIASAEVGVIVLSRGYLGSRWCVAEMEALVHREIDEGTVAVIPMLVERVEMPALLRNRLAIDISRGVRDVEMQQLRDAIQAILRRRRLGAPADSFSGPPGAAAALTLAVSSVLDEYPVSSLSKVSPLSNAGLLDLYRAVERLIGSYETMFDELMEAGEVGRTTYGSARRLSVERISATNRRLADIAHEMREIAVALAAILPDDSLARRKFEGLLRICASISIVEDIAFVKFGRPAEVALVENGSWTGVPFEEVRGLSGNWRDGFGHYHQALSQLADYKRQLRGRIAELQQSDIE